MEWCFGIITGGNQESYISQMIDSIENQNIPKDKYEIIVIGSCDLQRQNLRVIKFNENVKPMWITAKKNTITKLSKFENICYMHDYIVLDNNWYNNFKIFGEDWDVCMNAIKNLNGTRFRDWVLWAPRFVNYDDLERTHDMYVSGSYFCAKKSFMIANPFDESLSWGQGEDVEWSLRIRNFWKYRCNPQSIVKFLKQKPDVGYIHESIYAEGFVNRF